MQTREKFLAIGLGAVLVFWVARPYLEATFVAPLQKLEGDIARLTTEKDLLWKRQLDLATKEGKMKEWRSLSLPPNPENAQRLYQEWLTNLALLSGFEISKMTLDKRIEERVGNTVVSATIPVTLEARAQLRELVEFLERFESTELLQRISRCHIVSPSSEGNPELAVTLTAEGLSMKSAPERARLFSQTELFDPVVKDATKITVVSNSAFPETLPFCVRIGTEFLNVIAMEGNTWTVQRGVERTFADQHAAGSVVEHFPLRVSNRKPDLAKYWGVSLFTKPAPLVEYKPRLSSTTPPPAIRGKSWNWKLELAGWNPAFGTPKYELVSGPPGLELNERNGTLQWRVSNQTELGNHPVSLLIWGTNGRDAGFSPTVSVRVRDPNVPPQVEDQNPLRFFIGRESTVKVSAKDPDGKGKPLTFAIEQGPNGMAIDGRTGELKWKPGDDATPLKTDVKIKVTDSDEFPESVTVTIPVSLEEDSARFTYLTSYIRRDPGGEEVWIFDRATNRTTVLAAGDNFRVADFDLTIEKIGPTFILVKRGDQLYRWKFEQPLTEMSPEKGT